MISEAKKHNGEIDLFRFVFSLIILFYHWNLSFDIGIFEKGFLAVEFFFVVSGFLMCAAAKRILSADSETLSIPKCTWKFILKKIASFYPYYVCVLFLQLIVRNIIINGMGLKTALFTLLRSISTFLLSFIALNAKNVTLYVANTWYLAAMILAMFILFPLLLKHYERSTHILFPLIFLFGFGFLYKTCESMDTWQEWTGFCYSGTIRAVSEIALGCSLYELSSCIKNRSAAKSNTFDKVFFTVIKYICYIIVFVYTFNKELIAVNDLSILLICSIGVLLSFSEIGFTIPDTKLTRYLAKISLAIYVFHGFIRWSAADIWETFPASVKTYFVFAISSIIISILLMYLTDLLKKLFVGIWKKLHPVEE